MVSTTPPVSPVTTSCIMAAAQFYQVPVVVLTAVMAQEGGSAGHSSSNSNGTHDHGPMQINSVWLANLKRQGISPDAVANNGCLNIYVGAAILKKHANEAHGNWWKAIGNYHSKTPSLRNAYLLKVASKIQKMIAGRLTVATILKKAND